MFVVTDKTGQQTFASRVLDEIFSLIMLGTSMSVVELILEYFRHNSLIMYFFFQFYLIFVVRDRFVIKLNRIPPAYSGFTCSGFVFLSNVGIKSAE